MPFRGLTQLQEAVIRFRKLSNWLCKSECFIKSYNNKYMYISFQIAWWRLLVFIRHDQVWRVTENWTSHFPNANINIHWVNIRNLIVCGLVFNIFFTFSDSLQREKTFNEPTVSQILRVQHSLNTICCN